MHSFTVTSTDNTALAAYHWPTPGKPRASILIIHGMATHARRYGDFAQQLADAGVAVYAFDLRGHGATARALHLGHFDTRVSWQTLLDDVASMRGHIQRLSGPVPVVVWGHSMGAFIAQGVMQTRGADYAAAILSGCAMPARGMCHLGRGAAALESLRLDATSHSRLLRSLTFDRYARLMARRIGGQRTRFDWLSNNNAAVDDYIADPQTGFELSITAWRCLLSGIARVQSPHARRQTPQQLPLLIIAGSADPVGHFGRSPQALANAYANSGQTDVTTRIYDNARHELLHDLCTPDLAQDMRTWLAQRGLIHDTPTDTLCEIT